MDERLKNKFKLWLILHDMKTFPITVVCEDVCKYARVYAPRDRSCSVGYMYDYYNDVIIKGPSVDDKRLKTCLRWLADGALENK